MRSRGPLAVEEPVMQVTPRLLAYATIGERSNQARLKHSYQRSRPIWLTLLHYIHLTRFKFRAGTHSFADRTERHHGIIDSAGIHGRLYGHIIGVI